MRNNKHIKKQLKYKKMIYYKIRMIKLKYIWKIINKIKFIKKIKMKNKKHQKQSLILNKIKKLIKTFSRMK